MQQFWWPWHKSIGTFLICCTLCTFSKQIFKAGPKDSANVSCFSGILWVSKRWTFHPIFHLLRLAHLVDYFLYVCSCAIFLILHLTWVCADYFQYSRLKSVRCFFHGGQKKASFHQYLKSHHTNSAIVISIQSAWFHFFPNLAHLTLIFIFEQAWTAYSTVWLKNKWHGEIN